MGETKMPDTCTIVANTITCSSEIDWPTVFIAVFSAIVPAIIGVLAAMFATKLANRHQREEASKQRKIVATAAIMRSAYNMVRSSHRDKDEMRDHASEFEISIRVLSVELRTDVGEEFVRELHVWRTSITQECRKLPEIVVREGHDTDDINAVRRKNSAFVKFLNGWLHLTEVGLAAMTAQMRRDWTRLWPEVDAEQRLLPRLGADSQGA